MKWKVLDGGWQEGGDGFVRYLRCLVDMEGYTVVITMVFKACVGLGNLGVQFGG